MFWNGILGFEKCDCSRQGGFVHSFFLLWNFCFHTFFHHRHLKSRQSVPGSSVNFCFHWSLYSLYSILCRFCIKAALLFSFISLSHFGTVCQSCLQHQILCFYSSMKFTFLLKHLIFKICLNPKPECYLCQNQVFVLHKGKEGIVQGLPYDCSPVKRGWNIQDMCHTCMIYITLSVDTYILLWSSGLVELSEEKLPLLNPLYVCNFKLSLYKVGYS